MKAGLQTSATAASKMARAGFVVIPSQKMKTIDEGQVKRRRLVLLLEIEKGILRK
jgi:hypothetical protein